MGMEKTAKCQALLNLELEGWIYSIWVDVGQPVFYFFTLLMPLFMPVLPSTPGDRTNTRTSKTIYSK